MHESTEVHHLVPRHLLDAHDRMQTHAALDGVALQLWFEYEGLLLEFGLDPDASREELQEAIESSAVVVTYEEHRSEIHAADWPRWGRKGGLATLKRYGRGWFACLARRRWGRITAGELARVREELSRVADPVEVA
jgi:hypothetical protein